MFLLVDDARLGNVWSSTCISRVWCALQSVAEVKYKYLSPPTSSPVDRLSCPEQDRDGLASDGQYHNTGNVTMSKKYSQALLY